MPARYSLLIPLGLLFAVAGCGEARFQADEMAVVSQTVGPGHAEQIEAMLTELFGTPDEPRLPDSPQLAELISLDHLRQAAGPVASHEVGVTTGLYRRHCARCHGVTGDGRGPTAAYQRPYPRDFRRGVFKFTSTPRGVPPTDADLHATLSRGGAGTAMPSFALLAEPERDALVDYVKYLAIRGQLERELIAYAADEFDYSPVSGDEGPGLSADDEADRRFVVDEFLGPILTRWANAAEQVIEPPTPPTGFPEKLVDRGRELFADQQRVGCVKCHGDVSAVADAGQGAVPIKDFDVWNWRRKEFTRQTASLSDELTRLVDQAPSGDFATRRLALMRKTLSHRRRLVGEMLPPVAARPRSLGAQALRGGAEPADLFRHIQQGIDGTPMPSIAGVLSDEEVWSLVAFVLHASGSEVTP